MLRIIAIAALLILAAGTPAHAEPISLGLLAFAGITATPGVLAVTTFLVTSALSMGVSLLSNAIFGPDQQPQNQTKPGIQFEIQMGDSNPIAFPVGRTATGGTRRYIGTWGNDGETPNAFLTDVIQIGDIPARGLPGIWVNGQKCTLDIESVVAPAPGDGTLVLEAFVAALIAGLWPSNPAFAAFVDNYVATHGGGSTTPGTYDEKGIPVLEFRVDGKDHLWVKYNDGTQTSVDTFLGGKFGAHPERPWLPNMVGFGCPHVIVTSLFNRELFSSSPTYLIEPPVTSWYDVRKDSTEGGSGSHRWGDWSTYEPTENPIVIAYNIARGVYYTDDYVDEWMFGGQDLASLRLPASAWMAAANECDADRDLEGGGTEPQYRCGMEIRGDMEPLTVIQELMKGCAGRFAENGGIFKPIVGAPGSAVYSFSDGDVLVTKGQTYAPFPALSDTHNGIEATYPEPAEAWQSKDAPARYSSDLEADDGDRRLATGVSFAAVPYAVQVQQLMRIMIEEERGTVRRRAALDRADAQLLCIPSRVRQQAEGRGQPSLEPDGVEE